MLTNIRYPQEKKTMDADQASRKQKSPEFIPFNIISLKEHLKGSDAITNGPSTAICSNPTPKDCLIKPPMKKRINLLNKFKMSGKGCRCKEPKKEQIKMKRSPLLLEMSDFSSLEKLEKVSLSLSWSGEEEEIESLATERYPQENDTLLPIFQNEVRERLESESTSSISSCSMICYSVKTEDIEEGEKTSSGCSIEKLLLVMEFKKQNERRFGINFRDLKFQKLKRQGVRSIEERSTIRLRKGYNFFSSQKMIHKQQNTFQGDLCGHQANKLDNFIVNEPFFNSEMCYFEFCPKCL